MPIRAVMIDRKPNSELCFMTPITVAPVTVSKNCQNTDDSIRHIDIASLPAGKEGTPQSRSIIALQSAHKMRSSAEEVLADLDMNVGVSPAAMQQHHRLTPGHFLLQAKKPVGTPSNSSLASQRLDVLRQQHCQLLSDIEAAKTTLNALSKGCLNAENDIETSTQTLELLKEEIREKEKQIEKLSQQEVGKIALLEEIAAKLAIRRPELQEAEEEVLRARANADAEKADLLVVTEQLENAQSELKDHLSRLRNQFHVEVEASSQQVEAQLAAAQEEIASLEKRRGIEDSRLNAITQAKDTAAADLAELQKQIDDNTDRLANQYACTEIGATLQGQMEEHLERLRLELQRLLTELTLSQAESQKLKAVISSKEGKSCELDEELVVKQQQLDHVIGELQNASYQLASLKAELPQLQLVVHEASACQEEIAFSNARLESLVEDIASAQHELLCLHAHTARAMREKQQAQEGAAVCQKTLADLQMSIISVEKVLSETNETSREASMTLSAKILELSELEESLASEQAALISIRDDIRHAKIQRQTLLAELDENKNAVMEISQLKTLLSEALMKNAALTENLHAFELATAAGQKAAADALQAADARLFDSEHYASTLEEKLESAHDENSKLEHELSDAKLRLLDLTKKYEELKDCQQIDERLAEAEVLELSCRLRQYETELITSKAEAQKANDRVQTLETHIHMAKQEVAASVATQERGAHMNTAMALARDEAIASEAASRRDLSKARAIVCDLKENICNLETMGKRLRHDKNEAQLRAGRLHAKVEALENELQLKPPADFPSLHVDRDQVSLLQQENSNLKAAAAKLSKALASSLNSKGDRRANSTVHPAETLELLLAIEHMFK